MKKKINKQIEKNKINKRIKELEKEVQAHEDELAQYQQIAMQLQTAIVSKKGGLVELKNLEDAK